MTRLLALGLIALCLPACATHYAPIKVVPPPADVPDAALVAPCDTANGDPSTNRELALEAAHNRRQRNDCAARMDGVRDWRAGALKRADDAAKATGAAPATKKGKRAK